jgi:hypothetical protein
MKTTPKIFLQLAHSVASLLFLLIAPILHAAEPRITTVVFFADKEISDSQWSTLFAVTQGELQAHLAEEANRASAPDASSAQLDLRRGDRIQLGIVVDASISVYLHGDCTAIPAAPSRSLLTSPHPGALGWVERTHGQITPFIHINCALIAQMLSIPSHFTNRKISDLLSLAIARIFLHEWLHIVTQNPHHAHSGIAKSEFNAEDLIGHPRHWKPQTDSIFIGPAHGK